MVYDIFISIILGVSPYTSPMNNEMRIYFCISICEMNPTKPSSPPLASLGNRQQLESPEQFQSSAVCAFIIERHTRFKAKKDPAVGGLVGWGSCTISSLQLLRYVVALSFGDKRRATNFFLHDPIIVQMQLWSGKKVINNLPTHPERCVFYASCYYSEDRRFDITAYVITWIGSVATGPFWLAGAAPSSFFFFFLLKEW